MLMPDTLMNALPNSSAMLSSSVRSVSGTVPVLKTVMVTGMSYEPSLFCVATPCDFALRICGICNGVSSFTPPSPLSVFGLVPESESSVAGCPFAPSAVAVTEFWKSSSPPSGGVVSRSTVNTRVKLSPGASRPPPLVSSISPAVRPSQPAVLIVGNDEPEERSLAATVGPEKTASNASVNCDSRSSSTTMFVRSTVPVFSTTTTYSTRYCPVPRSITSLTCFATPMSAISISVGSSGLLSLLGSLSVASVGSSDISLTSVPDGPVAPAVA